MLTRLAYNTLILAPPPEGTPYFLEMNIPMIDIGVKHVMLTEIATDKLIYQEELIIIFIKSTG